MYEGSRGRWKGVEGVDEVEELMKVGERRDVKEVTDS